MATNPDFEVANGVEIVTKTVKREGKVTTTTTTTLIPMMGRDSVKGKGKVVEISDSDDSDGSCSLADD
jgi:hypothetical protein